MRRRFGFLLRSHRFGKLPVTGQTYLENNVYICEL